MTTGKELPKNRIAELRKNKKLSQSELAKGTGLTRQAISLYEIGKREPKLETWIKLADFFDVSVSYIQGISDISDNIGKIIGVGFTRNNEDSSKKKKYINEFLDNRRLWRYQLLMGGYRGKLKSDGDIVPNKNRNFYHDYLLESKITNPQCFIKFMKTFETIYESFLKGYSLDDKDCKNFFEKIALETNEFETRKGLHKNNKK